MVLPAAVAAAAIAAGCSGGGGGGGGGNGLTGTIKGTTFTPKSAVFVNTALGSGANVSFVIVSDTPNFCDEIGQGKVHQGAKLMELLFADINGTTVTPPSAPGTYSSISLNGGTGTPPPKIVGGAFAVLDTSCQSISASSASTTTGGSVDLTTVNASTLAGHGTLVWDSGDSTGLQLDATECPGLIAAMQSTSGTCVP